MAVEGQASSELSKIAQLNGDFSRNYGILLGAFECVRKRCIERAGASTQTHQRNHAPAFPINSIGTPQACIAARSSPETKRK
ncbi:hypothetical protein ABIB80_007492 [Bradyrhizobium sp. i1.15.2]|uniref:hypothetical protein n=1 Tax=Bradyrhizobium sp. i1.15.2 TaxID=3156362 RepID=UPI00339B26E6